MAKLTLQEQMLKAGLVNEKKTKESEKRLKEITRSSTRS